MRNIELDETGEKEFSANEDVRNNFFVWHTRFDMHQC